ncbi:resolvase [Notoacmeibacter marinus]|uniref:Resolvase n=1 Tax=Notoacmeibacter marinus TaxID=1876515 RepID=A0A231V472_9HYPH|nr:resolvase [Notoacmeibacter marinus]
MIRAAIYARYSSDQQREASIEDQIRVCRERAEREGWAVINCYTDHAISGASLMRPGIQMLMQDGAAGNFDVVLAEDLDRLSRDQEDIAGFYKRMSFADIEIHTLSDGKINDLHIGLKGTMNARFLKDLAQKTRRGLRGRVEAGKSGGGNSYGYKVVKKLDAKGEPIRGDREIIPEEAEIIRRIFMEFAAGHSPRAIAAGLNEEKIPGPRGKEWGASTIYGNRRRGNGILNNDLYIGKLVWNRLRYIKDPDTGKRVSRLNPKSEWLTTDVPELRIVDDELWQRVKGLQDELAEKGDFRKCPRPPKLLSHLLKCSECGGGFSKISNTHYGCSTARNKATCTNRRAIKQDALEEAVINALRTHLMDAELCERFCEEYTAHMNHLIKSRTTQRARYERELRELDKQTDNIIEAIKAGLANQRLKEELDSICERESELKLLLTNLAAPPPILHPSMALRYKEEVTNLVRTLNDPDHRAEASQLLRKLVDKIVLKPDPDGTGLLIDLYGDLAGILNFAAHKDNPLKLKEISMWQETLVAGVGFEPTTFRL